MIKFFKVVSFDFGEVFYCEEGDVYNVYTRAAGYSDFVFQFGVSTKDVDDIEELVLANCEAGNLFYQVD